MISINDLTQIKEGLSSLRLRVAQLEAASAASQPRGYPSDTAMREAAARAQACQSVNYPAFNDLRRFVERVAMQTKYPPSYEQLRNEARAMLALPVIPEGE